ncbi:hypothetical protein K461DRAFT_294081 [Myriangium duriaei CBS 260.36]|uniref:Nucleoporin NSP1-like C-terminal domain-containing protein n=1 Tax=Myriangium duriaei CBS 260.36 TaxID=1168546 RepID=A0A9P4J368_9PEZI|nr:hypothetical protein K461DRAFT_294081 [Myriangium duriaei CBS 260.36]
MAFGRSNSLSINTGAANSSFGQQNQTTQPSTASGLFGAATSKPGGIFGSTPSSQPQNSPSVFGSGNNATNTTSTAAGGLFGNTAQQSQPQQSGGLFSSLGQGTQSQTQTQTGLSGGLFGGGGQNQSQTQPAQTTSTFGGLGQSQNQQTSQPAPTSGLFSLNKPPLFNNTSSQPPPPQQPQQPSLLGQSLFNNSTTANPLAGSLTMGQGNAPSSVQPGVKIDLSNIRPTTRFSDLHDDLKSQIEQIDNFIKQQESYASQCEALLPSHSSNMATIPPDVALIESKAETVELGLENDGRNISAAKETLKTDVKDLTRCARVIENQSLPSRFHYGPGALSSAGSTGSSAAGLDDDYDVDLLGYFSRQAEGMHSARSGFEQNLAEIEAHLAVVERRTAALIGEVGRDRASTPRSGDDTVRELADTLRGFEGGILDAARRVGGCREGLEDLVVGRRY